MSGSAKVLNFGLNFRSSSQKSGSNFGTTTSLRNNIVEHTEYDVFLNRKLFRYMLGCAWQIQLTWCYYLWHCRTSPIQSRKYTWDHTLLTLHNTHFMAYMEMRYNFEQRLSKTCPVMCIVQLREAEQSTLVLPLAVFFFYPRSSHCKISIAVGGLPCITCQAYFSHHPITLE